MSNAEPVPIIYDLNKKRPDYLEWPEYFMAIAFLSAQRSKDPGSQVGACIVNKDNKIVGIGYNGMPNGCNDDELPWRRIAENKLDTKYPYVCHAEMNAIMNKNSADVKGCTMYVALFPCNECAKLVIQAGIKELVYVSDKYHDNPDIVASRRLLNLAGVAFKKFEPKRRRIVIDFDVIDRVPIQSLISDSSVTREEVTQNDTQDAMVIEPSHNGTAHIDTASSPGDTHPKPSMEKISSEQRDVSTATKRSAEEAGLDYKVEKYAAVTK